MRIIAGRWRSRLLVKPASSATRPMPDRVREAIFDMLGSYYDTPGGLPALRVADVFAGSGSMGLEALSRGAASCCFFERGHAAVEALKRNFITLCVGAEASLNTGDAWRAAITDLHGLPFELVLLDPPYADSNDNSPSGAVRTYLARIAAQEVRNSLVVLHHHHRIEYAPGAGEWWGVFRQRRFGSNMITFIES